MAPKDHRQDDGGGGAGGATAGGATAGKRTITQGIVQKKDPPGVPSDLSMRPKEHGVGDGGLPKNLQPVTPNQISDDIDQFRRALEGGDRDGAANAWGRAKKADRIAWTKGPTFEREFGQAKRVMGAHLLQIMEDTGLTFASLPGLLSELLRDKSAKHDWVLSISHHTTLWNEFLHTLGDRETLTEDQGKNIGKMILKHDDLAVVKKLFAYVYAPLTDESYSSNTLRVRPWKLEWVHKLYNVLSAHLPIGHVQSVKDFSIGYEKKEKTETKWHPIKAAWWNRKGRHVVLTEKSTASEDGGGKTHNMTGGARSGEKMNKFDAGALHEVGHGVGQELGGNDWAMAHPWVGWTITQSEDEWSKGLWGSDGDLKQRAWDKLGEKAEVLDASEARIYMAHRIANKTYTPTTPGFGKPADVERFIRKHYADQKLTQYWEKVMKSGDRKKMYKVDDDINIGDDDRVYVYLTRGDSLLSSYNAVAFRKRVSDYSTSSPREWFAEQYAHYYRLHRTGDGLEAGTKAKLDELHGQRYGQPQAAPADPDGLLSPDDNDGSADESEDANDRAPFPW